jgi:hypothetical protein
MMKSTEDLVVEEMQKYKFRATPVNKKILQTAKDGACAPLPVMKEKIKPTVPQPFKFATDARISVRKRSQSQSKDSMPATNSKTGTKAVVGARSSSASSALRNRVPLTTANKPNAAPSLKPTPKRKVAVVSKK